MLGQLRSRPPGSPHLETRTSAFFLRGLEEVLLLGVQKQPQTLQEELSLALPRLNCDEGAESLLFVGSVSTAR